MNTSLIIPIVMIVLSAGLFLLALTKLQRSKTDNLVWIIISMMSVVILVFTHGRTSWAQSIGRPVDSNELSVGQYLVIAYIDIGYPEPDTAVVIQQAGDSRQKIFVKLPQYQPPLESQHVYNLEYAGSGPGGGKPVKIFTESIPVVPFMPVE